MALEKKKRTELSELGEFGLIDHLTKNITLKNPTTVKGVGDDAAVIGAGEKYILVTKDLLMEDVHFDLAYSPLKHLGYKAAAVNISDIAAMNGRPKQMIIGLALSNRFSVEALEELYDGLLLCCEKYGVDLAGGDVTTSVSGLALSVTVIGEVEKDRVVYRSTAGENDLLCVSGDLGAAYMGLLLLEREKKVYESDPSMQPDLEGHDYVLERQLKPEPRTDIVEKLDQAGILPTAMIDISDGLGSEILHICEDSGLGCRIYEEKLPIDPTTVALAGEFKIGPWTAALNGGEDYELLFTIGQKDFEKIRAIPGIHVIGHMTDVNDGVNLVTASEALIEIRAQGWDALRRKAGGHQQDEEN